MGISKINGEQLSPKISSSVGAMSRLMPQIVLLEAFPGPEQVITSPLINGVKQENISSTAAKARGTTLAIVNQICVQWLWRVFVSNGYEEINRVLFLPQKSCGHKNSLALFLWHRRLCPFLVRAVRTAIYRVSAATRCNKIYNVSYYERNYYQQSALSVILNLDALFCSAGWWRHPASCCRACLVFSWLQLTG